MVRVTELVELELVGGILGAFWPPRSPTKALKVGLVVKGITCKLIPHCQRP